MLNAGFGFRVQDLGLRISKAGFRVEDIKCFRVQGLGLKIANASH